MAIPCPPPPITLWHPDEIYLYFWLLQPLFFVADVNISDRIITVILSCSGKLKENRE
jgi:hypothetical protein